MAPIAEGSIDDGQPSHISFRVDSARLVVMPEEHQTEVLHPMLEPSSRALGFLLYIRDHPTNRRERLGCLQESAASWPTQSDPSIRPQNGQKIHRLYQRSDRPIMAFNRSIPSATQ